MPEYRVKHQMVAVQLVRTVDTNELRVVLDGVGFLDLATFQRLYEPADPKPVVPHVEVAPGLYAPPGNWTPEAVREFNDYDQRTVRLLDRIQPPDAEPAPAPTAEAKPKPRRPRSPKCAKAEEPKRTFRGVLRQILSEKSLDTKEALQHMREQGFVAADIKGIQTVIGQLRVAGELEYNSITGRYRMNGREVQHAS